MQGFQASKFMGECKVRQNTTLLHYPYAALMMTHKGFLRCSFLNLLFFLSTVTPRNTGCQGTNKFHPLLADFHYCQYRKSKEITSRDQGLAFLIGGFPLLLGPVLRGLTVPTCVLTYRFNVNLSFYIFTNFMVICFDLNIKSSPEMPKARYSAE